MVRHAAAYPVFHQRGPLLPALTTASFSSMVGLGEPPTLGVAHRPCSPAGQAPEPPCEVRATTDLPLFG
jgi:hypothetical protein